ncbi:hypothetical protein SKAU_G00177060 [Synaphobranchus kaupii]|uniref:Uncharacterized protein n=1 Tax=Synaphobranchus kaupii TaxID=118154 RepID=A0A9Q1FLQ6_SYNKA|nr:hypothetical protein SKAU_G00177060 [Synaphobranchus kaupii]
MKQQTSQTANGLAKDQRNAVAPCLGMVYTHAMPLAYKKARRAQPSPSLHGETRPCLVRCLSSAPSVPPPPINPFSKLLRRL